MKFLTTLIRGVCVSALPFVLLGSTVAQEGAILLYEQNYSEAVSFSRSDGPLLRDFYVVLTNSPNSKWSGVGGDVIVAPFETPSLSERFSGSFIVDTTLPKGTAVTVKPTGFDGKMAADSLRLYVGRSKAAGQREAGSRVREAALALVDSKLPFSTLSFVRFDIKEWEVLDSVVSYDIDISFWGRPAAKEEAAAGLES